MSSYNDLLKLINSFEAYLGNPAASDSPINFQQSLQHDELEQLAWSQINVLQQWGFMDYLIPEQFGGKFVSMSEAYFLAKSVARRDITTSIALGLSFLGALPIWIAGSPKQKEHLAKRFRLGEIAAFALTEEEHGSDLAANEVSALPTDDGWELSGKKWCINFATLGHSVTLLCRTHEKGGLLGFSVFFLGPFKCEVQQ